MRPTTTAPTAHAIAIVGIGLRFPGSTDPGSLWEALTEGRCAIGDARPRLGPVSGGAAFAGLLDDVHGLDAALFRLTEAEVARMDPQQRLLLEVGWEALEDAAIAPEALRGQPVGVFVGISAQDHAAGTADPGAFGPTGAAHSIAANRLSYALDLRGPSMAVDTACSSSLVALALAARSLRSGESSVALAAGVNAILDGRISQAFADAGFLAPGGRCRAFDAGAEGYVRGEGCGVVVLKRLDDALADEDRIYAVIRGEAVNQDGASNGLTAPNPAAQEAVIRSAWADAGLDPREAVFVEAHGTGTRLGDPLELKALSRAMHAVERADPLWVGSVKSNLGHLEAAAGIAGVIRAALSLRHRRLPPHLHLERANPLAPPESLGLRIPTEAVALDGPLLAGVSGFGFGGTNAHVVLASPPERRHRPEILASEHILTLSAHTPGALAALGSRWREALAAGDVAHLCHTANTGRARLRYRAAAWGSPDALLAALDALSSGREHPALATGRARRRPPTTDAAHTDPLAAAAHAFVDGADVDLAALSAPGARRCRAPTFAFERPPTTGTLRRRLDAAPAHRRAEVLRAALVAEIAALLDVDPAAVDPARGLVDQGLDSLGALALRQTLERELDTALPATAALEAPTVDALVHSLLHPEAPPSPPAPTPAPRTATTTGAHVAIVGLSCRLPGAPDPAALWDLLRDRRDAIGDLPADRWSAPVRGGFLDDVAGFDDRFFGISPREARSLDPQQRLFLEVAWEALESAGLAPDGLSGTQTGVFLGIGQNDWAQRQLTAGDLARITPWDGTGNGFAFAAGRLAWLLGLRGPVHAVDTACSSSLVALHLATRALRSGECDRAIVGGVQLVLSPEVHTFLQGTGALAPDGRCKPFTASADGFGRGEGCVVVVLEREGDRADARILARVAGSAVNHNGRASGLTVPSGEAQQLVVHAALADAELSPADLDYIEAHGTGTPLGDPIELRALGAVLGGHRDFVDPLPIGSVKANIGHLEAAAGLASVAKIVLALEHGTLPAQPAQGPLTDRIDWASVPVEVLDDPLPWPRRDVPRRAGVSAFGMSGTNAHVVLEEGPRGAVPGPAVGVVPLSARSPEALRRRVADLAAHLDRHPDLPLASILRTTQRGRAHHPHRLAVVAGDVEELRVGLQSLSTAEPPPARAPGSRPRVAFLFCGQGAQHAGMARGMYSTDAAFRATFDQCADRVADWTGEDLRAIVFGRDPRLNDTTWTQPALFAVQAGLVAALEARGVRPDAVLGHSIGEVAAAWAAGVLSLDDALTLAFRRGALMGALPDGGAMIAARCPAADVRDLLGPGVSLAAINGPSQVVLSGDADAVTAAAERLAARGVSVVSLTVSHAFHSHCMDPVLDAIGALAAELPHAPATADVFPTGGSGPLSPAYWRDQARSPVDLHAAATALFATEPDVVVEIGPRPVLAALVDGPVVPCLTPGVDDGRQLARVEAALYTAGVDLGWASPDAPVVSLPTTPFERRRHWIDPVAVVSTGPLGTRLPERATDPSTVTWELELGPDQLPGIEDHQLGGVPFVPGVVYSRLAAAAARELYPGRRTSLEDVAYHGVFFLRGPRRVQLSVDRDTGRFEVYGRGADESRWTRHASGRIRSGRREIERNPGATAHG